MQGWITDPTASRGICRSRCYQLIFLRNDGDVGWGAYVEGEGRQWLQIGLRYSNIVWSPSEVLEPVA